MGLGQVVNVQAMLTGNATGMQSAFAQGSASAKAFQGAYAQTAAGVQMSSAQIQAALLKEAAAAQAASASAIAAAEKAAIARGVAAAQANVAADREVLAHAKAAAAAKVASEAKVRADALGTQSAITNAAAQQAAAERAANTATLASQQKVAAAARAAKAAEGEAVAVAAAMRAEEGALAQSARAAEYASAQKQASQEKTAAVYTKLAAGVTLAAAAVGIGSVMMAADFEKSTLRLHTSGGMAMSDLAIVRDGILEIAQSTGTGAKELADGMYDVVSGGYMGADALNILKAATQGAKAEGADLSIMAKGLTAVMASYNIPASEAVQTTNAISTASGMAKGSLQEFTGSLATILPVAANVGISFAEISAAVAIMTQSGKSADQATQELRNGLLNLSKPNEVAAKLMQQLGIDANDVSQNLGNRGLGGTLNYLTGKILESADGNKVLLGQFKESEEAARAMSTMIGSMPPQLQAWSQELMAGTMTSAEYSKSVNGLTLEEEALGDQFLKLAKRSAGFSDTIKKGGPETVSYTGALATMMGGTTGLQVALDLTGHRADAFTDATKRVSDAQKEAAENVSSNADVQGTVAAAWDRLTATVGVLAIQLGQVLLPAAQGIIGAFSETIRFFQENEGAAQALGLVIAWFAGSIVLTTIATHAWAAAQWIAAIATGGLTGAMHALKLAFLANPIGIVIGLLLALAAGFIWAYENVGWFKDGVDTAMKVIGEVMGGFFNWVTEEAIPAFIAGWEEATRIFTETKGMFEDFFNNTFGMFEDFNNNTKGMFEDFSTNTQATVQQWSDDTTGMFEDFNTNTQGMFDDFFKTFGEAWAGYWKDPIGETEKFFSITLGGFTNWSTEVSANLHKWMDETFSGFQGWSKDVSKALTDWIDSTWNGFVGWTEDVNKAVNQWATDTWNGFINWANNVDDELARWAQQTWDGFINWANNIDDELARWAVNTWEAFKGWVRNVNATVNRWIEDTWNGFIKWTQDVARTFTDWYNNTRGMFQDWVIGIIGMFQDWYNNLTGKTKQWVDQTIGMFVDFGNNTKGMFNDLGQHIANAWNWINDRGRDAINWMNTNVFSPFHNALWAIGRGFEIARDAIGRAWNAIRDSAKAPVKFVVDTIYTNGIRALWNPVATTFGLAQLPAAPNLGFADGGVAPRGFHSGGHVPGYSPGIDNQTIAVSGGEAIMRPEWTRVVGVEGIRQMNAAAKANDGPGIRAALGSTAGRHFADGGVFNPGALLNQISTGPGKGTPFGDAILGLPVKLISSLVGMAAKAVADAAAAAMNAIGAVFSGGNGGLMNPLPSAYISQRYHSQHNGLDMAAPTGTTIRAAGAGKVSSAGWSSFGGGNEVHIDHANGLQTWYAHMNGFGVSRGQAVQAGQGIGPVGSTGNSTGPHLHFMVLNGGWPNHMNPAPFIGLANGGVVPTFDRGGTLAPGLNRLRNATGSPEPLTPSGNDIDRLIEALQGARFEFDIDGISRYVAGRLVLSSQRRAGKG